MRELLTFLIPAVRKLEGWGTGGLCPLSLSHPRPLFAWRGQEAAAPKGAGGPGPRAHGSRGKPGCQVG